LKKKFLFCLLISGSFYLTSCVDEKVSLDDLSMEMLVGGYFEAPLIRESKFTMYDLLDAYHPDVEGLSIDTTLTGEIFLFYEKDTPCLMPDLNSYFSMFNTDLIGGGIGIPELFSENDHLTTLLGIEAQTLRVGYKPTVNPVVKPYNLNDNLDSGDLENKQKLTRMQFWNTDLVITVKPTFEVKNRNVITMEIRIPGVAPLTGIDVKDGGKTFHLPEFQVNAADNIQIIFSIVGDGETTIADTDVIDCSIVFKPSKSVNDDFRYIAYGFFNYTFRDEMDIKIEDYVSDLYDYVPKGSVLKLENPQFKFTAESSIGIPLLFHLDKIASYLHKGEDEATGAIHSFDPGSVSPINRSDKPGESSSTDNLETVNKSFFETYGHGEKISNYFTTELDSLQFNYSLTSEYIDIENLDPHNPGIPEQFIPSDGQLNIHGELTVPMAFDEGSVLCYSDTVKINFTEDTLDDIKLAEFIFTCRNAMPIGMFVDIYLLDEDKQKTTPGKPYQHLYLGRPEVYTEGPLKGEVKGELLTKAEITFQKDTETSILELKKAKYILYEYKSDTSENPKPAKLTTRNYVKMAVGVRFDGKITISDN
jgi:hypothetical protein